MKIHFLILAPSTNVTYGKVLSVLLYILSPLLVRGNLSALSGYQSFTRSENFFPPKNSDPDFLILLTPTAMAKHYHVLIVPLFSGS